MAVLPSVCCCAECVSMWLRAVCQAKRYEASGLQSPLLSHLIEEGLPPSRALAVLNALAQRQRHLPRSHQVSSLMAVSRPETAGSPLVVATPKLEEPLSSIASDWRQGVVPFLPLLHALWAGERGAAAGAAAAGALSVASQQASEAPTGTEETDKTQPLNTWASKVADKLGRDVSHERETEKETEETGRREGDTKGQRRTHCTGETEIERDRQIAFLVQGLVSF